MASHDLVELCALRSPHAPCEVLSRLQQVGRMARLPMVHPTVIEVELAPSTDPLTETLDVLIESRPRGSYVTTRVLPNRFLHDFVRLVSRVLTLYAVAIGIYLGTHLSGAEVYQALFGVGAGWACVLVVIHTVVAVVDGRKQSALRALRLHHQLAELLCR